MKEKVLVLAVVLLLIFGGAACGEVTTDDAQDFTEPSNSTSLEPPIQPYGGGGGGDGWGDGPGGMPG